MWHMQMSVVLASFALKTNLANLETDLAKLDITRLTPAPNDLAKLSNVVKKLLSKRLNITNQSQK